MNTRLVSRVLLPAAVASTGLLAPLTARAAYQDVSIPADTVVRLRLEDRLSSRDARVGQTFASVLAEEDRSGFPVGTRFQGMVTDVEQHSKDRPGMLDVRIERAYLPDGQKVALDGRLAGLGDEDVRHTSDGRIESRSKGGGKKPDWKWAGYGAAGGAVLSTIFGGNILKGVLLGGLGGAAYGYLNKKGGGSKDFRDVDLPRGTEYGMRLDGRVAFNDRGGYRYTARHVDDRATDRYADPREPRDDRYADRYDPQNEPRSNPQSDPRDEERYPERPTDERNDPRYEERNVEDRTPVTSRENRFGNAVVRIDGRTVQFRDQRPRDVNGVLYVPMKAVAEAANMRFLHRRDSQTFVLDTPDGLVDGRAGEARVFNQAGDPIRLDEAPMLHEGDLFVSAEFLSRVAGYRTSWDRGALELNIETRR